MWLCLRITMFRRFIGTLTCDRHTRRSVAYTAHSIARAVKVTYGQPYVYSRSLSLYLVVFSVVQNLVGIGCDVVLEADLLYELQKKLSMLREFHLEMLPLTKISDSDPSHRCLYYVLLHVSTTASAICLSARPRTSMLRSPWPGSYL